MGYARKSVYTASMGLLLLLMLGFKGWMWVDAIRRQVPMFWFFVLLLPAGSFIYFFAIKLPDFRVRPAIPLEDQTNNQTLDRDAPRPNLDLGALRIAVQESPSFDNRVALGFGLLYEEHPQEAKQVFEQALSSHPQEKPALVGLGAAELDLKNPKAAIEHLGSVVDRTFAYRDYGAAHMLVQALKDDGAHDDALALAERIARHSRRYEHAYILALLQIDLLHASAAKATLQQLIDAIEAEPDYIKRRTRELLGEARKQLRGLSNKEP